METPNTDSMLKPTLSSTKSIDEGFESDPDSEQSNTESDSNQLAASVVAQPQAFDVLQTTDRDGVQHTQIARRSLHVEFPGHKAFESGALNTNVRRNKDTEKNRIVYPNPKVSIPRAGATNQQRLMTTNATIQPQQLGHLTPNHLQFNSSIGNNSSIADPHNHRHRLAFKPIELGHSRLAKSTELMLRNGIGRERMNFPNAMDNLSQVALINGKLICVNMPVTQIIPSSSIPSASASSLANASHNHTHHQHSKRHFSNNNNNSSSGNQATKISNNHHQKYISSGRVDSNDAIASQSLNK